MSKSEAVRRIRALVFIVAVVGLLGVPGGAASPTLTVGIECYSLGHGQMECHADVSGGTGSYTYSWTPTPTAGGEANMICNCTPGRNKTVSLTVTDSNGASDSASTTAFCGAPPL